MTSITGDKKVVRHVHDPRWGSLVVELRSDGIYIREKGRRTRYSQTYGRVFQRAAEDKATADRLAKKAARKSRKSGKLSTRGR